ncbi:hypothetical protein [Haloarchaeobius sp. HRN-SO-5]|uniref:hypothetical protein n=1 Tax=Haloarchaeobius sp. HRN-SO-5 TaxID=3446118 RepID=UPI003EB7BEE6
MRDVGLRAVWSFAQESTFVHWLVVPLSVLSVLLVAVGATVLPVHVVLEVTLYFLVGSTAVMAAGLTVEWALKRWLADDEERAYY